MRKPFEFVQTIKYTLSVRADSLEEAETLDRSNWHVRSGQIARRK